MQAGMSRSRVPVFEKLVKFPDSGGYDQGVYFAFSLLIRLLNRSVKEPLNATDANICPATCLRTLSAV
jgi:hypothetical protein